MLYSVLSWSSDSCALNHSKIDLFTISVITEQYYIAIVFTILSKYTHTHKHSYYMSFEGIRIYVSNFIFFLKYRIEMKL